VIYEADAFQLFGFASLSAQPNPSVSKTARYVKFARCPSIACDSVAGIRFLSVTATGGRACYRAANTSLSTNIASATPDQRPSPRGLSGASALIGMIEVSVGCRRKRAIT
jgi:hypothetical protein